MGKTLACNAAVFCGLASLLYGLWLIWPPVFWIVAGLLLVVIGGLAWIGGQVPASQPDGRRESQPADELTQ
jgi:uncharacterized membrane protein